MKPRSHNRAVHQARLEMAVARYSSALWEATTKALDVWLRQQIRRIKPSLERLVFTRADEALVVSIASLLGDTRAATPPSLARATVGMTNELALQVGFLPRDPRARVIRYETRGYLESDLGDYWRTLTDPVRLARRIAKARENGVTTSQLAGQLSREYRADYSSAERLVRTTYNTSSNRAQWEALKANGYASKQWLTAGDSRVRRGLRGGADHLRMNRVTVPIEAYFVTPSGSRMMYPGDRSGGARAGDILNCRCTVLGVRIGAVTEDFMPEEMPGQVNLQELPRNLQFKRDGMLRYRDPQQIVNATMAWLDNFDMPRGVQPKFVKLYTEEAEYTSAILKAQQDEEKLSGIPQFIPIGVPRAFASHAQKGSIHLSPSVYFELASSLIQERAFAWRTIAHEYFHAVRRSPMSANPLSGLEEGLAQEFAERTSQLALGGIAPSKVYRFELAMLRDLMKAWGNNDNQIWREMLKTRTANNLAQWFWDETLKRGFTPTQTQKLLGYKR